MKSIKYTLLFLLCISSVFMTACKTDILEKNVPEFEICTIERTTSGFLQDSNFLMWWDVLGPIPANKTTLHTEHIRNESMLTGMRTAPKGTRWYHSLFKNTDGNMPGIVDLSKLFLKHPTKSTPSVFYACISVKSSEEMKKMTLLAGSSAFLKVWVNGSVVYAYELGPRAVKPDTDKTEDILLRKGFNRIVVKYMDSSAKSVNSRKFCLRFTDANGKPTRIR